MSNLSSNLQKNEQLVLEGKTHWATLIVPGIFTVIAFILFSDQLALALLIGLILLVPKFISVLTTELSLSNKRLVGKYGFITSKQMDSPLNKINSISVENGLFGKIFGYGKITVNTASTVYVFKNIAQAEMFKHSVLEEIDRYDEARVQEQAAAIAGALKQ